jgi:hypothetical protein
MTKTPIDDHILHKSIKLYGISHFNFLTFLAYSMHQHVGFHKVKKEPAHAI